MSMRTTLDLDEDLFRRAAARYPVGTPKTVIVEEGLRRLAEEAQPARLAPRRLGFFAHLPVGIHEDFDAPLSADEIAEWEGG